MKCRACGLESETVEVGRGGLCQDCYDREISDIDVLKRGPGRPRKWRSNADRVAMNRVKEREVKIEVDCLLSLLRRGYVILPDMTGRETDAELIKRLRVHIESKCSLGL